MGWRRTVSRYQPTCEQEQVDKQLFLEFAKRFDDVLTRKNQFGHLTATAFIVNEAHNKMVMVYHNIMDGWTLPGGHADGNGNLLVVASCEAEEEIGARPRLLSGEPFALQVLPVESHRHRERGYVPAHTHYDATYLFELSEDVQLNYRQEESSGIKWVCFDAVDSDEVVSFMRPVHRKLVDRLSQASR